MSSSKFEPLRNLPAIDTVLLDESIQALQGRVPMTMIKQAARDAVASVRARLLDGEAIDGADVPQAVIRQTVKLAEASGQYQHVRAINATGIILHTGLGRAVLPQAVLDHIANDLAGYSVLQLDRETGERGTRDQRIQKLLTMLTGAEAATVVNNNAAATALVLAAVCGGREVIVSRGQLVEIGGSFRLPEVMEACGAKLVEVGTTNKTHAHDYENAITENTAALMRVHPSNYKISGFTGEVPLDVMAGIAKKHNLALIDDLGAGALLDMSKFELEREPLLRESIEIGADLVTCSADKLIGSGQGGIILGKREWLKRVRRHPMARITRADKLTLAALDATLPLFLDEEKAVTQIPTYQMLNRPLDEIRQQAERILETLRSKNLPAELAIVEGISRMGSGSLPTQPIPTRLLAITPQSCSVDTLARRLRLDNPPIFGRVQQQQFLLDPRTLRGDDEVLLIEGIVRALS